MIHDPRVKHGSPWSAQQRFSFVNGRLTRFASRLFWTVLLFSPPLPKSSRVSRYARLVDYHTLRLKSLGEGILFLSQLLSASTEKQTERSSSTWSTGISTPVFHFFLLRTSSLPRKRPQTTYPRVRGMCELSYSSSCALDSFNVLVFHIDGFSAEEEESLSGTDTRYTRQEVRQCMWRMTE